MHYTIDYKGMDKAAKRAKAIKDCQDFLGDRYYGVLDAIQSSIRADTSRQNIRWVQGMVELTGIAGYPARALVFHAIRTR
jgi:hypothetical protein